MHGDDQQQAAEPDAACERDDMAACDASARCPHAQQRHEHHGGENEGLRVRE